MKRKRRRDPRSDHPTVVMGYRDIAKEMTRRGHKMSRSLVYYICCEAERKIAAALEGERPR